MKSLLCLSLLFAAPTAFAGDAAKPAAGPTCFELSRDGKLWSRTPEMLCVGTGDKAVEITMKTGLPPSPTVVATFHLDLTNRVRCADCNQDVFSLSNPTNSVFNELQIVFDGKRDASGETGTVSIGKTSFHYRRAAARDSRS